MSGLLGMPPHALLLLLLLLCIPLGGAVVSTPPSPDGCCSVVITMISRDEEVNFRSNLALWLPIAEYFAILVDSRTTDDSVKVIEAVLRGRVRGFHTEAYEFTGFGPARTKSLQVAWSHFPEATHVLIADPDWKPDTSTMNVNDLDLHHTVFRFTVHDRNGETKRLMDWFLRHEEGLRMRYHLHEVLDNGLDNYIVKHIPWVAHEIEKPGTWHSKVGHGDSHSVKRLQFDLSMLAKDQVAYGHDPHTHYYLGITNHGVAEGMYKENKNIVNETIVQYAAAAVDNLLLRLHSEYMSEFGQERWGVLFILADVYEKFFGDHISAERYYLLCFDLKNFLECPLKLLSLYQETGNVAGSKSVVWRLLTSRRDDIRGDRMLTFKRSLSCHVPSWAYSVLTTDLYNRAAKDAAGTQLALSSGELLYLLLLKRMIGDNACDHLQSGADQLLAAMLARTGAEALLARPAAELCSDPALKAYVFSNKITLYPCDAEDFARDEVCKDFARDIPPPIEALQVEALGEFVGALSIFDLAHHTLVGHCERFFFESHDLTSFGPVYTVLLAGSFNPRLVHFFLGYLQRSRYRTGRMHLTIAASKKVVEAITGPLGTCGYGPFVRDITFDTRPLQDFLARARELRKNYDYIEYQGLSTDAGAPAILRQLRNLLSPSGVMGVSYFAANSHQQQLQQQVLRRNISHMYPFSFESWRLVEGYLQTHGYSHLVGDRVLICFLALDIDGALDFDALAHDLKMVHSARGRAGRAYRRAEAEQLLLEAGLAVISHASLAYGQPFAYMPHASIQAYRDLGVEEDVFVEELMPSFRHVVYVRRDPPLPDGVGIAFGRAAVTAELMTLQANSSYFLWRSSPGVSMAYNDSHCSVTFSMQAALREPLAYSFDRAMMEPLLKLQSSPQFGTLLRMHSEQSSLDAATYRLQLLQVLQLLETHGIIVVWYTQGFQIHQTSQQMQQAQQEQEKRLARQVQQTEGEQGGLSFRNVKEKRTFKSGADSSSHGVKGGLSFKMGAAKTPPGSQDDVELRLLSTVAGSAAVITDDVRHQLQRLRRVGYSYDMIEQHVRTMVAASQGSGTSSATAAAAAQLDVSGAAAAAPISAEEEGLVTSADPKQAAVIAQRRAALRRFGFPPAAIEETLAKMPGAEAAVAATSGSADYSSTGVTMDDAKQQLQLKLPAHRRLLAPPSALSEPTGAKRSTAAPTSTSMVKVRFELEQMLYLTEKKSVGSVEALRALACYQQLHARLLQSTPKHLPATLPADLAALCPAFYNKGVHLAETAIVDNTLMFTGPLPHLKKVVRLLETTDFIVMDVILKPQVLQQIAQDLLSSTIWYDAANGQSFVAHKDDGLFHASFRQLVRELSWALSHRASEREEVTVTAKSFFVIGMTAGSSTSSPLMVTATNSDMFGVLWVSPSESGPVDEPGATDGLRVYDTLSSDYLNKGKVRIYNATHTEFLSYGASLSLNVERFNRFQKSEVIPRVNNRLVMVGPGNPFMLVMPPEDPLSAAKSAGSSLEERTVFALVIQFSVFENIEVPIKGPGEQGQREKVIRRVIKKAAARPSGL